MIIIAWKTFTADWQEIADLAETRTIRGENGTVPDTPSKYHQDFESNFFSAYDPDEDETRLLSLTMDRPLAKYLGRRE